jgi:hypothetical protein
VLRSLRENGISGAVITAATPGIEDVFLELMKKEV